MTGDIYDRIGAGYARHRQPEPRWTTAILDALGGARTVVNVGAGSGSYEPGDRRVIAVEPSTTMIAQRPPRAAPVLRAVADRLPFGDGAYDAAMAVLTVHHWPNPSAGLTELRRVSHQQVVLTWDPAVLATFWLLRDYLPEAAEHDLTLATLVTVTDELPESEVAVLPIPATCTDGVLGAYWRRPEAYLDPSVRASISGLALVDQAPVDAAMGRLESDLADGTWARRHGHLLDQDEVDLGYRLVVAGPSADGADSVRA